MITEKIGAAHIEMSGDRIYMLLSRLLRENISIIKMKNTNGKVSGIVDVTKLKRLTRLCERYGVELKVQSENGLLVSSRKYYKHFGLLFGFIVAAAAVMYLSNVVLQIRIIGADTETRRQIDAVLEDFDIGVGTFIPSIDQYALETALQKDTDSIAWAGIRQNGSELIINISQIKQKPDMTSNRLPASIVAGRSAVITDFQVYCGDIDFLVGDAVAEGQILISGEYTDKQGNIRYRYSQASIRGRFNETQTFYEPYVKTVKVVHEGVSEESREKRLRFFNTDISFSGKRQEGRFIENKKIKYFSFLGITLPIGVTSIVYDSYEYQEQTRSEEQVMQALKEAIDAYEKNFLDDCDVLDRKITYKALDDGIYAEVIFTAEGEIGEQIIHNTLPKNREEQEAQE